MTAAPHAQIAASTTATPDRRVIVFIGALMGEGNPKGSAACSIKNSGPLMAAELRSPMYLPSAAINENGITNFVDATSQIQYRICARFLLNASVSSAAAAANNVDCHR